jgi:predicted DNA-binding transcriptional regulator YafY
VEKREISFAYHSRSGKKNVQVYPLGNYYEQGYWYMPASKQGEIRLYRVDRMEQLYSSGRVPVHGAEAACIRTGSEGDLSKGVAGMRQRVAREDYKSVFITYSLSIFPGC